MFCARLYCNTQAKNEGGEGERGVCRGKRMIFYNQIFQDEYLIINIYPFGIFISIYITTFHSPSSLPFGSMVILSFSFSYSLIYHISKPNSFFSDSYESYSNHPSSMVKLPRLPLLFWSTLLESPTARSYSLPLPPSHKMFSIQTFSGQFLLVKLFLRLWFDNAKAVDLPSPLSISPYTLTSLLHPTLSSSHLPTWSYLTHLPDLFLIPLHNLK